ncbi:MAG: ABC transporter ATP-binding protein, partial [Desulfobacterales bacterium]
MSDSSAGRNYSAFDLELTHQALNVRLFIRLLKWMGPYRKVMLISIVLAVLGSVITVLLPAIGGRVIIDTILLPNPAAVDLPDYGLITVTTWVSDRFSLTMLHSAGILYLCMMLFQSILQLGHQLTLFSSALRTLRDLRLDLFASLEHKPATFYDHVAVGRVMTRVTNDVESLFQLLTGFGQLANEFVPFFLGLFMMMHFSSQLTGVVVVALPIAALGTYIFRILMSKIFRLIRDSVSALNQYMQEDLSGIEVVQLSGREAMNISQYTALNQENRKQEFRAINYEIIYENFNNSLASVVVAGIVWYGGGKVVQDEITLGTMVIFTGLVHLMIQPVVMLGQQFNIL